jgi:hypothetical protein
MPALPRGRLLLVSVGLSMAAALGYLQRAKVRCELIDWSDLKRVEAKLYVDPRLSQEETERLLRKVAEAQARDARFFGVLLSKPVIIAGPDNQVMDRFGQAGNRTALTYLFLGQAFIVLGPDGMNLDVIAHEIMHAELARRVGFWNRAFKVPTWFDEGLAMQADEREPFSELHWQERTKAGTLAPDLIPLTSGVRFFAGDIWANFATAKHEVRRWLTIVGTPGLLDFIDRLNGHESFASAYREAEERLKRSGLKN